MNRFLSFCLVMVTLTCWAVNPHVSGKLLVKFKDGTSQGTINGKYATHSATEHGHNHKTEWRLITVTENDSTNILNTLLADSDVELAQFNYVYTNQFVPNDTYIANGFMWHLTNINAFAAWDVSKGSTNVVIAVVDTGVDETHPDFVGQFVAGTNVYSGGFDTMDVNGHGTGLAGEMVALLNNNAYGAGVAGACKVMPIRVTDSVGSAESWSIANGVIYAADHGCRCVNVSFMASGDWAISAAASYLKSKGGLLFCAAGNGGGLDPIADDTNMVNVAGIGLDGLRWSHSNYGPPIDIAAPAEQITGPGMWSTGFPRQTGTGTSGSCPLVAATAALMWSANPSLTPDQVDSLLKSTATDLGTAGWDQYYGWGSLNAGAALVAATNTSPAAPPSPIIPTNRVIAWKPGIPGGVPNRTTIASSLTAASSTATIQSALTACPSNQVVFLAAGTYLLTGPLTIPTGVTLRGTGTNTVLYLNTPGIPQPAVKFAGGGTYGQCAPSANFTTGSKTVTLDPACGSFDKAQFTLGTLVVTSDIVGASQDYSENDGCPWCGPANGRWVSQMFCITNASGTTLTFDRGAYRDWTLAKSTVLNTILNQVNYAGLESLRIVVAHPDSVSGGAIEMQGGYRCWVKNVEVQNATKSSIWMKYCKECEIRECVINYPQYTSSGAGYGVHLFGANSDNLIEDNSMYGCRHSMVLEGGGSGNVFSYNNSVADQSTDSAGWVYNDLITHGAHPFFNLYEGNKIHKWSEDIVHGSAGYNTGFRNWITAGTEVQTNYVYTTAHWAVAFEPTNHYMNVVGNVLGAPAITNLTGNAYEWVGGSTDGFIYRLGYYSEGGTVLLDTNSAWTAYRHGNYDYVTDSTIWASTNDNHTLPTSLYLSGKPSWWGAGTWPAYGPDLTPRLSAIPAESFVPSAAFTTNSPTTNTAPTLPVIANQTVNEQTLFTIADTATDAEGAVTYQLLISPTGLSITSSGIISWTPTEAQGSGAYVVKVKATDDGGLAATNNFTITVNEVNRPPVLGVILDKIVLTNVLTTISNQATDPDVPANPLAYQLVSPPSGCTISVNGTITWKPAASQLGIYSIKTIVNDSQSPPLTTTNSFVVTVTGSTTTKGHQKIKPHPGSSIINTGVIQ